MRIHLYAGSLLMLLGLVIHCGSPPQVIQGSVVSYDASAKTLVVRDENEHHRETTFSLEEADIGAEPGVGDVVRIAYRDIEDRSVALRVMIVSRISESEPKGH